MDGLLEAAAASDLLLLYVANQRRTLSGPIGADLASIVDDAQFQVVQRKQALFLIKRALDRAHVRWVVMKGPILATRFYPVEWAREYNDLDIVVHPDDLEAAIDALCSAGAVLLDRNWAMIARKGQGEISITWGSHLIDLHWHFYSAPLIRRRCCVDMRVVLSRRREIKASGLTIPVLDDLDGLVFLATHAVLSGGHRARWVVDFALAFNSISPDPAELFERAREHDAALQLAVMIRRVESTLATELCEIRNYLNRPERAWCALCALIGYAVPVENGLSGRPSGRALFSASRDTAAASAGALLGNLLSAVRGWLGGSSDPETHRLVLHQAGGTNDDRVRWLRVASTEGGGLSSR